MCLGQAKIVGFGEAMLRLTPLASGPAMYGRGEPSARANFMQSVGGDELNVAVIPAHGCPVCGPAMRGADKCVVCDVRGACCAPVLGVCPPHADCPQPLGPKHGVGVRLARWVHGYVGVVVATARAYDACFPATAAWCGGRHARFFRFSVSECACMVRVHVHVHVHVCAGGIPGDIVLHSAIDAGVAVGHVRTDAAPGAEVGLFTVLPDQKRVFYQRRLSSFARQDTATPYPWAEVFAGPTWLHATGITPLCSEEAFLHWDAHLTAARAAGVPIRYGGPADLSPLGARGAG